MQSGGLFKALQVNSHTQIEGMMHRRVGRECDAEENWSRPRPMGTEEG
jgi:hypothetical protein